MVDWRERQREREKKREKEWQRERGRRERYEGVKEIRGEAGNK